METWPFESTKRSRLGIFGVESQEVLPDRIGYRREGHGRSGMSGIGRCTASIDSVRMVLIESQSSSSLVIEGSLTRPLQRSHDLADVADFFIAQEAAQL